MQKTLYTVLLSLFVFTFIVNAQYSRTNQENFKNTPISHVPSEAVLFSDDMNGDNTLAGIQTRGWVFADVDGAGTTTVFQGNATVFPAYEGPTEGYIGQNYNGAFGGGLLIDQWLISPPVAVTAGDTLKFWHRSPDGSTFPDPLQVWISTTGGITPAAFDVQLASFMGSTIGWQQFVGNFTTTGTVTFAVRYYTTNGGPAGSQSDYIGLDLFEVISPVAPLDFWTEDFNYPAGDTLNAHGWNTHSGAGSNPITINPFGLVFPGSPSSGVGLAALMDNTGEDVHKLFPSVSSGTVYASFMASVVAAPTGYFFHFAPNPHNTFDFRGRVWVKTNGSGGLAVGYSYASSDTLFTPFNYTLGDTLLFVSKYEVVAGTLNDIVSLYIFENGSAVPLTEPVSPTIGPIVNATTSADIDPGSINLRQFNSAQNIIIDGIRLGTMWDSVVPVELTSFAASVNGSSVNLNWSTATELNNSGFDIERKSSSSNWTKIGFVPGYGTTTDYEKLFLFR